MHLRMIGSRSNVTLMPGDHYVSDKDVMIATVLGSCVSVCLYDPVKRVVGMNHFLLSGRYRAETPLLLNEAGRYGVHAMELIINAMLKLGAVKKHFRAKAFGGASILPARNHDNRFATVGDINSEFILQFLKNEGIQLVSFDLGGTEGRSIRFYSHDFAVYQKKIKRMNIPRVVRREKRYWERGFTMTGPEPEIWE